MKNFEFPQQKKKVEEVKKEKDTRGPGGGFFAGFNQSSKSKMAEVSKKEKEEQSTKMKQYREIIGVVQGSGGSGGGGVSRPQTANKKTVADNRWVVDQALRKVEAGKQLMSMEVKRDYDEPKRQPAGVRLDHQNRDPNGRQAVGEPISVK